MGLDLAEIMICIEEEFEIDIREDSVADIETVGGLVDYVEREVRKDEIPQWKASQVFANRLSEVVAVHGISTRKERDGCRRRDVKSKITSRQEAEAGSAEKEREEN